MRKIIVTTLFLISLSTMAWAVDCPIPDTGQTKCYGNAIEITCPWWSWQPFYGQDAQYSCNPQSYTKLDANGNDLPESAAEWFMVRDNVTELIWEVKTDDSSIHDRDDTYNWQDGQDVFISALNSANFGGYNDWRMPTVKELSAIVETTTPGLSPSINTDYFPNIQTSDWYGSSTSHARRTDDAWSVRFWVGFVNSHDKSTDYYVRAVRGRQCEGFDKYIDHGDGTVTDTETGLMWQQDTVLGSTWQAALSYCENLWLAGYGDWRLPNRNELQSLVDYSREYPSINTAYFPYVSYVIWKTSDNFWSSTTYDLSAYPSSPIASGAWYVSFSYGNVATYDKSFFLPTFHVRAVRGGQCGSEDPSTTTTIDSTTTTTIQCPSEAIYGQQSQETELLRYMRDSVLSQSPEGKELITLYYEWSPAIVKAMEEDEEFKEEVKEIIDGILPLIKVEGE